MPALIAAAVSVGYVAGDAQLRETVNQTDANLVSPNTYGSAGFVIAIAALAIIMELLFLVVRICNIGLINLKVKIFLIIVSLACCMRMHVHVCLHVGEAALSVLVPLISYTFWFKCLLYLCL